MFMVSRPLLGERYVSVYREGTVYFSERSNKVWSDTTSSNYKPFQSNGVRYISHMSRIDFRQITLLSRNIWGLVLGCPPCDNTDTHHEEAGFVALSSYEPKERGLGVRFLTSSSTAMLWANCRVFNCFLHLDFVLQKTSEEVHAAMSTV